MNRQTFKLCAAGCCAAYLLAFLFLPFIALKIVGFGISGINCFSLNFLSYLPLAAGIAMMICIFALPGKNAGIVCVVGALIPLIVYFPFQGSLIADGLSLAGAVIPGLKAALSSLGAPVISQILTIGAGAVLAMIFGGAAAALCFLSENVQRPAERTAGLGASTDDDW